MCCKALYSFALCSYPALEALRQLCFFVDMKLRNFFADVILIYVITLYFFYEEQKSTCPLPLRELQLGQSAIEGMSSEIEDNLMRLRTQRRKLLETLKKLESLDDDEIKVTIMTLVNNYQEDLDFTSSAIQFRYDIKLGGKLKISDSSLLDYIAQLDEYDEFLENYKNNLVQKQFEIKKTQLDKFKELKTQKYGTHGLKIKDVDESLKEEESNALATKEISTDAKVLSTTKRITSKLAQSSQILQASLVQSELNFEDLTIQSDSLSELADKYGALKPILEKSDVFINDIKLSSQRDKNRMYYALIFFGLCLLKIFWGRLLKLPVMFGLRFFFYILNSFFAGIGLISRKNPGVAEVADFYSTVDVTQTTLTENVLSDSIFKVKETDAFNDELDFETGSVEEITLGIGGDDLHRIVDEL